MQKLFGLVALALTLFVGNTASAAPLECCLGAIVCAGFDKCLDCPRGTRATNGTTASGYQFSHCASQFVAPAGNKSVDWASDEADDEAEDDENLALDDQESQAGSASTCSAIGAFGAGGTTSLFAFAPVLAALVRRRRMR